MSDSRPPVRVSLVGAGPGDPQAITLRAVACLESADLVLFDYLVNPRVLEHAPSTAELICLGRHGQGRILSPEEVNQRMIEAALAGRRVVRLKGGDPYVFARGTEEVEALSAAGIPFEIVGGVTAGLASGSYAGIPVTHRKNASAVALVTGRQGAEADTLDHEALAKFPGTLVYYMGVTTAREWTSALIDAGRNPHEPAAIVRRCSWPDQEVTRCRLVEIADVIESRKLRPPAIVIIGDVVENSEAVNWFADRPLFGQTVLVTRPRHQAERLAALLENEGAGVLLQPAIEIAPPEKWNDVDATVEKMACAALSKQSSSVFDWIVFSSANGVRSFINRLRELGHDARLFAGMKIAAIGPSTAAALAEYHLRADVTPDEFRAEALADALASETSDRLFLLIRASRGRDVLGDTLEAAGGLVIQVVTYQSRDVTEPALEIATAMTAGKIDWVTVTSSAIARSLSAMFGGGLAEVRLASISPVTTQALQELGLEPAVEAVEYTMEGLTAAICANALGQLANKRQR